MEEDGGMGTLVLNSLLWMMRGALIVLQKKLSAQELLLQRLRLEALSLTMMPVSVKA